MAKDKRRKLITIDAETDPFKYGRVPKPFIWAAFDGERCRFFEHGGELVAWLSEQHAVAYAHNGGRFDFLFLIDYMEPYKRLRIVNGRTGAFSIGKCVFRDSYLILPTPLSAYKKDEIDYRLFEANRRGAPGAMEKIKRYLEGDCRYLYELVAGFRERYGSALTLASSAVALLRDMTGLTFPNTGRLHFSTFHPYYYGGRVECFEHGIHDGKKLDLYDVNSQYPTAMVQRHGWGTDYECRASVPDDEGFLSRSFITLETEALGAFPFRTEKGTLDFPADQVRRVFNVTGWEYIAARDLGILGDARVSACYTLKESVSFRGYVEPLFEEKAALPDKSAERLYVKLFLNSLYGKASADPRKYREYTILKRNDVDPTNGAILHDDFRDDYRLESFIGSRAQLALVSRPVPDYAQRFYNVATGASITGYARAMLLRAIRACKRPYYCDTDSLLAEGFAGDIGAGLGQWKHEGTFTRVAIAGKKLYAFSDGRPWSWWGEGGRPPPGWKIATKGVRLTGPEVRRIAEGKTIEAKKEAPTMSLKGGASFVKRKIRSTHKRVEGREAPAEVKVAKRPREDLQP